MNRIVKIRNLSKSFKGEKIIKDFSLDIYSGEVVCLLGNNGSGKTTLINLLTGMFTPENNEGDVLIKLDDSLTKFASLKESTFNFRKYVRLCQQNDFLFDELSCIEHLELVCKLRGINKRQEIDRVISEKIEEVNLKKDKNKRVKQISPGSKRKLSIAMSLIGDAKFIILDEPTSNLDLKSREQIWLLIKKIASNKDQDRAILVST